MGRMWWQRLDGVMLTIRNIEKNVETEFYTIFSIVVIHIYIVRIIHHSINFERKEIKVYSSKVNWTDV